MPIIRKVYGPFGFEECNKAIPTAHDLRWYFFGVCGDGEMSHWVLVYEVAKRKFRAANDGRDSPIVGRHHRGALIDQGISPDYQPSIHPRMFIEGDDSLTQEGRVTDILKSKLSPEDIAKATAASITRR